MKLIKVLPDHYVIADKLDIKQGEWGVLFAEGINDKHYGWFIFQNKGDDKSKVYTLCEKSYKITHSTKPFGGDAIAISLHDVRELIGELDNRSKFYRSVKGTRYESLSAASEIGDGVILGYNQALQDNKDKKYTINDMKKACACGVDICSSPGENKFDRFQKLINSLDHKTEWDVCIIEGKIKLL